MNGRNIFADFYSRTSRRGFFKIGLGAISVAAASSFGFFKLTNRKSIPGKIRGASAATGHLLREQLLPEPSVENTVDTLIIGGGISGLSAAWWLNRNNYKNFSLLELEDEVGGNSRSAENSISAYPWGAHYVPLAGPDAHFVRLLFEELGVIEAYDSSGLPIYNELYLCSDPHERLFIQGKWHEGLVPQVGFTKTEQKQYDEFFSLIEYYKNLRGADGKPAFTIPMELSSQDPAILALDKISFAEFFRQKNWDSKYLIWYANYCSRDDYGETYDKISAWAGLHYFASRVGKSANADPQTVLTWPEGNGWLVHKLRDKIIRHIQTNSLAFSIERKGAAWVTDYYDVKQKVSKRIISKNIIFSAPRFVGAKIIKELKNQPPTYLKKLNYQPWMVGNISLKTMPTSESSPLAWDNVSFYSNSLGYIVATHQNLTPFPKQTVITYYLPLTDSDAKTMRQQAYQKTHADWVNLIITDLERMHPGIEAEINEIDVWLWGHGMISPSVNFLWSNERKQLLHSLKNLHFAHSDMSGISIFEEAQYRGVIAAKKVLGSSK